MKVVARLVSITLADGTVVEMGRASMQGGQTCGTGWAVVRLNGGDWVDVDFSPGFKLKATIEACSTREEVEAFVLVGSQYPPYYRAEK